MRNALAALPLAVLAACHSTAPRPGPRVADVHSYAVPDRVAVRHVALDLELDFDLRQVIGSATLHLERRDRSAPLVLDTRDLFIEAVEGTDGGPRSFDLRPADPILGAALVIPLAAGDDTVRVRYRTHPGAAALQWLAAEQTDAGRGPFLYTQGQAILTRSWIPLQDTPGVRITFDATVRAPAELTVVMAAEALGRDEDGAHRFRMQQPIPSYLLALACGVLEFRGLSAETGVWAEPTVVGRAAAELEDMPAMLLSCEELFGPYRWGRFDVIILPPAFPFGGMENPRLTFATPTILAGDKSLVALIAHELAHSWSGNLVTNATWSDFWLNEGFTVYLEHRIMEAVYGEERAKMEILIGMTGLDEELRSLPPGDQVLHIDLAGRNPDDGMTAVPYDKGAAFLRLLEHRFGREAFDEFLHGYFERHAFQSISTETFRRDLQSELLQHHPLAASTINVDRWIEGTGLPPDAPRPRSAAFARVDEAATAFLDGASLDALPSRDWSTHEWLRFLQRIGPAPERWAALNQRFALTTSGNSEIRAAALQLAIACGDASAEAPLERFLLEVGRRKFLKPLYESLMRHDPERGRAIYARARSGYHEVTRRTLDALIGGD